MTDFKGQKIEIGDTVVFTMGGTNLRESTIEEIVQNYSVKLKRIKRSFTSNQILKIN